NDLTEEELHTMELITLKSNEVVFLRNCQEPVLRKIPQDDKTATKASVITSVIRLVRKHREVRISPHHSQKNHESRPNRKRGYATK
ncbi:hypothetical protein, partial [Desulfomarina sp.]